MKKYFRKILFSILIICPAALSGQVLRTILLGDALNTDKIEFGLVGGIGNKFRREIKSMAVGINYYYGLVNVSENPDLTIINSLVCFYMKIPIGIGKPKE